MQYQEKFYYSIIHRYNDWYNYFLNQPKEIRKLERQMARAEDSAESESCYRSTKKEKRLNSNGRTMTFSLDSLERQVYYRLVQK